MANISTSYLGMKLKSPVIAGSSGLTSTLPRLQEAESAGAGAVVLKSLFEEQIVFAAAATSGSGIYPESDDYIDFYTKSHAVDEYLALISSAKKTLSIPVIPSINCITSDTWTEFAAKVQEAGADALEVNMFFMPVDKKVSSTDSEKIYLSLAEKIKKTVTIPVSFKIGQRFSNPLHAIDQFYNRGINGVVLFNRFFEPDIDIESLNIVSSEVFSNESDRRYVLRWIAMASAMGIKIDISASTGVHSGADIIRYLLAGANTVQACSSLYKNGVSYISELNSELSKWMDKKGFKTIDDFRGKLNYASISKPSIYERSQFMKHFSSHV